MAKFSLLIFLPSRTEGLPNRVLSRSVAQPVGFDELPGRIGHGQLEDRLCQIDGNGCRMHFGLLLLMNLISTPMKTRVPIWRKKQGDASHQSRGNAPASRVCLSCQTLKRMRILTIAIALSFAPAAIFGADNWDWAEPHKARCSEGNEIQMHECIRKESQLVDSRLNEKYQALLSSLARPEDLRNAQRAWLAFREATCSFAVSGLQGPGGLHSFALASCRIDLAEKRIRDFAEYAQWNCNGCPPRKRAP